MRVKRAILTLTSVVTVSSVVLMGCSSTDSQEVKHAILDAVESPMVASIKAMSFEGTDYTVGELVEASLGAPTYEYFNPAEDGFNYVTIKGNITYNEVPVVATLQYKEVGEESFEFYTLTFNDVPQNQMVVGDFFTFLIESYESENVVEAPVDEAQTTEVKTKEAFETYTNARYGFQIDYPSAWGEPMESENGDGAFLYSDAYYNVSAYASYLVVEPDFKTYMEKNYMGWQSTPLNISGVEESITLEKLGEDVYQFAIVLYKDGTIYTFDASQTIVREALSEAEEKAYLATEDFIGEVLGTFRVLE